MQNIFSKMIVSRETWSAMTKYLADKFWQQFGVVSFKRNLAHSKARGLKMSPFEQ